MTNPGVAYAVVTGGGTSGHVLAALAVADALVARGHDHDSIHYVGATRGVERRLLPPTRYDYTLLDVTGLQRSLSIRNLAFFPKLVGSTWRALRLIRKLSPEVVVNVGGYASFPATAAAMLSRVPYVVVSYDRRPGLVSKLMARRAAACAVAFEGSTLPRAEPTGAPVRQEVLNIDRARDRDGARSQLDLPLDRFVFAVFGGSLGARRLNEVVAETVERLADRRDLVIYHVVGERNMPDAAPARDGSHGIMYRVLGYEDRMPLVYAAADLMMTRAGAATIAELATVGMPAIIVPWPGAAENHQVDNARELSDQHGAVLIEERDLTADRLIAELAQLITDPAELAAMSSAAVAIGERHHGTTLVDLIERVASS
ncbi:MAG: UDP-N-acetylglucosamine--N-acetylmuramyl-(pentapeptide) pyrophosphoryl-undecaprenol N-acetylglucosamine transferase [Ilumatobacteraceae bacterium]|nr:UDP-N-acetylglucosamine--N-acetylmuramyl-(pentapeptide) pyrophosphoryl-undecaprenol N-acetylglucosamine transferase [Ilumatobacteraceae bacterium]